MKSGKDTVDTSDERSDQFSEDNSDKLEVVPVEVARSETVFSGEKDSIYFFQ